MELATFQYILEQVTPCINKKWTNFNQAPIGTEEMLVVTIRYLATGASFRHLAFSFRMGRSTVASIIKHMIKILWNMLQPLHMPEPTTATFLNVSADFMKVWNFPNCIGAVDGKHVKVIAPQHSGSMYFNYKHYFSIVLQGVCDANYKLLVIDVGGYGKQSDGGTFQSSNLYKRIHQNKLNVPNPDSLPGTNVRAPYVFIADEAYPLMPNLLKPYNRRNRSLEHINFNQRLSRARKTIECTFGIMYAKWRLLSKAIETTEKTADDIIKAICILHNTILDREGFQRHLTLVTDAVPRDQMFELPRGRQLGEGRLTAVNEEKEDSQSAVLQAKVATVAKS
ncbi:unnamed protein product [Acanthoscelides obtectus]|uniref:DDE Tnp4 domain-containing protein n=1 Tax=Acanthoscelides obtectus TaxID=200917 RepID=A0A9P0M337_ACAOB|nr:unnamed protein product [Acanthoscelides obtectus]CAK1635308.1 Protein ALP1-like [Acanthoscelides obtectus]